MKLLLAALIVWAAGTALLAIHEGRQYREVIQLAADNAALTDTVRKEHAQADRREWSAALWRARYEDTFAQLAASEDELWRVRTRDQARRAWWVRYGPRVAMLEK